MEIDLVVAPEDSPDAYRDLVIRIADGIVDGHYFPEPGTGENQGKTVISLFEITDKDTLPESKTCVRQGRARYLTDLFRALYRRDPPQQP
jgi:hypothetical protein